MICKSRCAVKEAIELACNNTSSVIFLRKKKLNYFAEFLAVNLTYICMYVCMLSIFVITQVRVHHLLALRCNNYAVCDNDRRSSALLHSQTHQQTNTPTNRQVKYSWAYIHSYRYTYVCICICVCAIEFLGSEGPLDQPKQFACLLSARRASTSLIQHTLSHNHLFMLACHRRRRRFTAQSPPAFLLVALRLGSHVIPFHSSILFIHKNFFSTCARNLLRIFLYHYHCYRCCWPLRPHYSLPTYKGMYVPFYGRSCFNRSSAAGQLPAHIIYIYISTYI